MQLCPPCNTVSPETFAYAIVSGAMQKPSDVHVYDCTCMCTHKRACIWCTEPTYYAAWIFTYFMIAAATQRPNISHVIHDMHLARKKMANVFRRPRAFNLPQGRFCTCKCVQADTIALCSSVRADLIAYAKRSGRHYCICIIAYAMMSSG